MEKIEDNLCFKAYASKKDFPELPADSNPFAQKPFHCGGGLGGGSADGAFTLKLIK
jgi:4-diphosphocytidyl-2-C-methyl-D-erythritol kinase